MLRDGSKNGRRLIDDILRKRLRELAEQRKRFGSPRLHIMLKRERLVVNHKRTERIYREEGLVLRRKRRRKGATGARMIIPSPQRTNERWSMDFVTDSFITGGWFRTLAIVDDYSRECPAIEVDTSLGGRGSSVYWKGCQKSGGYRKSSPSITDRNLPVVP